MDKTDQELRKDYKYIYDLNLSVDYNSWIKPNNELRSMNH